MLSPRCHKLKKKAKDESKQIGDMEAKAGKTFTLPSAKRELSNGQHNNNSTAEEYQGWYQERVQKAASDEEKTLLKDSLDLVLRSLAKKAKKAETEMDVDDDQNAAVGTAPEATSNSGGEESAAANCMELDSQIAAAASAEVPAKKEKSGGAKKGKKQEKEKRAKKGKKAKKKSDISDTSSSDYSLQSEGSNELSSDSDGDDDESHDGKPGKKGAFQIRRTPYQKEQWSRHLMLEAQRVIAFRESARLEALMAGLKVDQSVESPDGKLCIGQFCITDGTSRVYPVTSDGRSPAEALANDEDLEVFLTYPIQVQRYQVKGLKWKCAVAAETMKNIKELSMSLHDALSHAAEKIRQLQSDELRELKYRKLEYSPEVFVADDMASSIAMGVSEAMETLISKCRFTRRDAEIIAITHIESSDTVLYKKMECAIGETISLPCFLDHHDRLRLARSRQLALFEEYKKLPSVFLKKSDKERDPWVMYIGSKHPDVMMKYRERAWKPGNKRGKGGFDFSALVHALFYVFGDDLYIKDDAAEKQFVMRSQDFSTYFRPVEYDHFSELFDWLLETFEHSSEKQSFESPDSRKAVYDELMKNIQTSPDVQDHGLFVQFDNAFYCLIRKRFIPDGDTSLPHTCLSVGYSWEDGISDHPQSTKDHIMHFIHSIIAGKRGEDLHEEAVDVFLSFMASFLHKPSKVPPYLALLNGPGGNGKGTILTLLKAAFGKYCGVFSEAIFQKLPAGDPASQFKPLEGVRLAISTEMNAIQNAEIFKNMFDGEGFFGRNPRETTPKLMTVPHLIGQCNSVLTLPKDKNGKFPDRTAFGRRLVVFPCVNRVSSEADPTPISLKDCLFETTGGCGRATFAGKEAFDYNCVSARDTSLKLTFEEPAYRQAFMEILFDHFTTDDYKYKPREGSGKREPSIVYSYTHEYIDAMVGKQIVHPTAPAAPLSSVEAAAPAATDSIEYAFDREFMKFVDDYIEPKKMHFVRFNDLLMLFLQMIPNGYEVLLAKATSMNGCDLPGRAAFVEFCQSRNKECFLRAVHESDGEWFRAPRILIGMLLENDFPAKQLFALGHDGRPPDAILRPSELEAKRSGHTTMFGAIAKNTKYTFIAHVTGVEFKHLGEAEGHSYAIDGKNAKIKTREQPEYLEQSELLDLVKEQRRNACIEEAQSASSSSSIAQTGSSAEGAMEL